jgi:hypothetical protein
MAKKVRAGKPITVIVGTLAAGSDPSRGEVGNPVKTRSTFTYQNITAVGHSGWTGRGFNQRISAAAQAAATGSITIGALVATAQDTVLLGDYELIEGVHWAIAGSEALTAINIAAAISNLTGFSAEVNGGDDTQVDVAGPVGPSKVELKLTTRSGNLTVSPTDGYMSHGDPSISAPVIT